MNYGNEELRKRKKKYFFKKEYEKEKSMGPLV